ncbi:Ras and/or Miro domain containing protein [Asbolus verrucosus]|uniref:Ras and/or Miro domain containing protein n=1 Tax=Asbolus verrucosus TaxID=1661398 RepID=A0A482VZY8_ASBVE|nr:Ras and/or Miro domain containing protein [Asbolus verrucosus]
MFSAIKRFTSKGDGSPNNSTVISRPPSHQAMSSSLQRKFARGVQYNNAEFLDVYKGTNGVIMMMDLTKTWTFDYVQRELPKVPGHIPVIILANHCDMAHHRTVTSDHVTFYIESILRCCIFTFFRAHDAIGFVPVLARPKFVIQSRRCATVSA